jgi:hypothetical protein
MAIPGRCGALAVEDPGDLGVAVVDGEAADEIHGVLSGADLGLGAADRHHKLAGRAALPPHEHLGVRVGAVAVEGEGDVLEQGV